MSPEELIQMGLYWVGKQTGDRADNIERSIAAFVAARDSARQPYVRANACYQLAMSLHERLIGDKSVNLAQAAAAYQMAVNMLEGLETLEAQNLLGLAAGNMSMICMAVDDVEGSIVWAERSLLALPKWVNPRAWGVAQQNLGAALMVRTTGSLRDNLERALAAFDAALEVRPADGPEPALHRRTSMVRQQVLAKLAALGTKPVQQKAMPAGLLEGERQYTAFLTTGDQKALNAAIAAYEAALAELDEAADTELWGSAMNNLAACYGQRGSGPEDAQRTVDALLAALRARKRDDEPVRWARSQYSLALAYLNLESDDLAGNAKAAVAAGRGALEVLSQANYPDEWLSAVHNLGLACFALFERSQPDEHDQPAVGVDLLLEAIKLMETAATRRTPAMPRQASWLRLQLGMAYLALSDREDVDRMTRLESEELAHRNLVRSRELLTDDMTRGVRADELRALLDLQIALALGQRSHRDPGQTTDEFIEAANQAMITMTAGSEPREWAVLNEQLGAAYLRRTGGDRAANLAHAVTAYEQALSPDSGLSLRSRILRGLAQAHFAAQRTSDAEASYRAAISSYADDKLGTDLDSALAECLTSLYTLQTMGTRRRWLLPQLSEHGS